MLWLIGVLVVTMVLVSALVLWHEQRILEEELRSRAELIGHILALAAAEGGSPEYLAVFSMTDVRAGEVRDASGQVLWRYGPSPAEVEALDASTLRVEQQVHVGRGPWGQGSAVDVTLLVSRARVRSHLAAAAVRLLVGLGIALTLALMAGLALIGQVVRPLRELAEWVRVFDPDQPAELPVEGGLSTEVRELAGAFRDMARRLASQRRSLVVSERQFRDLFLSSPAPLLRLDRDLCLRDANPAAESFLGNDVKRSVGRSVLGYLHGMSAAELQESLQGVRDGAEAIVEGHWSLGGGERAEVELRVCATGDEDDSGFLAAIHDLTDRVRRMGESWRRTFDAMVDGVALVDEEGQVTLGNQALQPHLEAVSNGLLGRLRGGLPREWRTSSAGRLLDCSLSVSEGLGHAILVVRDVTEAADAEERLRDAEKMEAVGTLASGVAHDFNNLLAAILLHARLLQRQPEDAADAVAAIRDLAEQGAEVVRELLLFARRENTPPGTLDLVELVRQQESVLKHLLSDGVELTYELETDSVPVVGSAVALRRLLLNLVVNARDAVAENGGVISVRVEHTAGRAVLEVADNGPGMSSEVRERLFEPFFTQRRQGRGSGLGLAVVYSVVSGHGGEIDVRSAPGEGARFIIRLPLGEEALVEPVEGRHASPAPEARLLLVEADGRSAARTVEFFASAGLDVRHAPSLEVATDIAERWLPTAVVLAAVAATDQAQSLLADLQVPAVAFDEADGVKEWGPQVVRLGACRDPRAILDALRDLGLIPNPPD
jgi:PAS domain S-box-containing protein